MTRSQLVNNSVRPHFANTRKATVKNQTQLFRHSSKLKCAQIWTKFFSLHDGKPIFGQTTESNNGNYCAVFNVDSEARHMCTNFRILKSNEDTLSKWVIRNLQCFNWFFSSKYYLIKPELFDSFWDDPVGFSDRFLVVVYDLYMDSSYFGTLHRPLSDQEPVVYAVDQNNAPVEIRGNVDSVPRNYLVPVYLTFLQFQP